MRDLEDLGPCFLPWHMSGADALFPVCVAVRPCRPIPYPGPGGGGEGGGRRNRSRPGHVPWRRVSVGYRCPAGRRRHYPLSLVLCDTERYAAAPALVPKSGPDYAFPFAARLCLCEQYRGGYAHMLFNFCSGRPSNEQESFLVT